MAGRHPHVAFPAYHTPDPSPTLQGPHLPAQHPNKMSFPSKTTGACTRKKLMKWFNAHYKEIQADCRAETHAILAELSEAEKAIPAAAQPAATPPLSPVALLKAAKP